MASSAAGICARVSAIAATVRDLRDQWDGEDPGCARAGEDDSDIDRAEPARDVAIDEVGGGVVGPALQQIVNHGDDPAVEIRRTAWPGTW